MYVGGVLSVLAAVVVFRGVVGVLVCCVGACYLVVGVCVCYLFV